MAIHITRKPILFAQTQCSISCPYYFPKSEKSKDLKGVLVNEDKGFCLYKEDALKEKCDCENPSVGLLLPDRNFGICENCGHFLFKKDHNSWYHYNRAYHCHAPYVSKKCGCPSSYQIEERDIADKDYDHLIEIIQKKQKEEKKK